VSIVEGELEDLRIGWPDARAMSEGGYSYVHLPVLKIPHDNAIIIREALFCPQQRDGYPNRLFLSEPVAGRGGNWIAHRILDKTWHTWSWNYVPAGRLTVMLAQHVAALR